MPAAREQCEGNFVSAAIHAVTRSRRGGFVLDSPPGASHERNAPYSWSGGHILFGWNPVAVLDIGPGDPADPFTELEAFLSPLDSGRAAIAIGYIAYDAGERVEPSCASRHPADPAPLLSFSLYETYFDYDPATALLGRVGLDGSRETVSIEEAGLDSPCARVGFGASVAAPISDFTRIEYEEAVKTAREYILAGDIFEVNLAQRFTAPFTGDAGDVYTRLRAVNPAPYAAFLSSPHGAILSASPELFLRIDDGNIVTRPIKGTRRRGVSCEDDAAQAEALVRSDKDNAELAMVIDLERNDLGRVCRYGSVAVAERARLETFARVHHLVSTIEGRVLPGTGIARILAATFPGGSITGAPKIRAMQIIDELEPCRRGVYTGALGYFLPGGRAELNISIRTVVCSNDMLSFHVGGAVTADSDPGAEYMETLAKAEATLDALAGECACRDSGEGGHDGR